MAQRPRLEIDLSGPDGNVFVVIGRATERLTGQRQEHFNNEVRAALAPDAGKEYEDILQIVNRYVRLVDTSGSHPAYTDGTEPAS